LKPENVSGNNHTAQIAFLASCSVTSMHHQIEIGSKKTEN